MAALASEWVKQLLKLLQSPRLQGELGIAGHYYVEKPHNWNTCMAPFGKLVQLGTYESSPLPMMQPVTTRTQRSFYPS